MSFKPRCWAKRERDGALCTWEAGHILSHGVVAGTGRESGPWWNSDCAPDAGPDGRETAALRLWEVSAQLDLNALLRGEHGGLSARLRAIAARLRVGVRGAGEDLAALEQDIAQGHRLRGVVDTERRGAEEPDLYAWLVESIALLSLAAEILRPFAEGR